MAPFGNGVLASEASAINREQQRPGPAASAACHASFDRARGGPDAVCKSGFFPRLPSEGFVPETRASWADASAWEDCSTQSGSSPRGAVAPAAKKERASTEEAKWLDLETLERLLHSQAEDTAASKKSKRSHRRRRRNGAASMPSEVDLCDAQAQNRGPPNVVTLGDLGFDLDSSGALRDATIPTVSMPAPPPVSAACKSPGVGQGWVPVPSPCRSGGLAARPQPMPLSTGMSTLSGLPEVYPLSPMKCTRDASTRQALSSCTVGPWSAPGAPPGNLSPVHGNSLAVRAPSLSIEVCATSPASASHPPATPGTQSPHFRSRIMSTQPIAQPQLGEGIMSTEPPKPSCESTKDGLSLKKSSAAPTWSPAGTLQADALRSWLHASGLNVHADLEDQLRAAAPEIYED